MSFEDLKKHILEQDDRHTSNTKMPASSGKMESAPNFDAETAFGPDAKDGLAKELNENIKKTKKQGAPHKEATLIPLEGGGFLREYTHEPQPIPSTPPTKKGKAKMDVAPIFDEGTAFGEDGK